MKISGPRMMEATEDKKRLNNEKLHNLYGSSDIITVRWVRYVARLGNMRNAHTIFVGKPEGKRPFGRPKRKWEDNIRMNVVKRRCESVDWIHLTQDSDK
jgi:hypothetical protein